MNISLLHEISQKWLWYSQLAGTLRATLDGREGLNLTYAKEEYSEFICDEKFLLLKGVKYLTGSYDALVNF